MKLFVCLVALFASAKAVGHNSPTITINHVEDLVESLEDSLQKLHQELAEGRTRCDEGEAKINQFTDVFLLKARLNNQQEDDRIDDYKTQFKAIQDRVDAAKGQVQEAFSWALEAKTISTQQIDFLNNNVGIPNSRQEAKISQLYADIEDVQREYLDSLNHTLKTLYQEWEQVRSHIQDFRAEIKDTKCEYGIGSFDPNNPQEATFVPFLTEFSAVPQVSLFVTGFSAHLDVHTHHYYHSLSLVQYVSNVTSTGFTVGATDSSEGKVEVEQIFCSWVACQDTVGELSR